MRQNSKKENKELNGQMNEVYLRKSFPKIENWLKNLETINLEKDFCKSLTNSTSYLAAYTKGEQQYNLFPGMTSNLTSGNHQHTCSMAEKYRAPLWSLELTLERS